ncbi:barrier-to-autointegration factor-like [Gadus macrocephalus]|uniref:barrier-to-autointegration factor-like n=1 Tax=Gadus macrocephalus TaxID=80720 RepID=UPI0028CB24BB|nr:barrier-to-autointegration factor-like [Gadus macrocephalus]
MSSTSKKHSSLVSEPLGRKRADTLPGIGHVLGERLVMKGFEKASMVVGQYMVLGNDEVRFNRWLHNTCGANNKQQYECHKAIKEWCDSFI